MEEEEEEEEEEEDEEEEEVEKGEEKGEEMEEDVDDEKSWEKVDNEKEEMESEVTIQPPQVPPVDQSTSMRNLRESLSKINSAFSVSGEIYVDKNEPLVVFFDTDKDNMESKGGAHRMEFPLTDSTIINKLVEACSPASFGFKTETVLNPEYRQALKIDSSNFLTSFDVYRNGIVDLISKALVSNAPVCAELHKLNVYGPGGFFKPHVDTPLTKDMFGSLVVCLPAKFEGGILRVTKDELTKKFDWGPSCIDENNGDQYVQWVAFFSDCPHDITPVTSGHRITLTYNLYKRSPNE
ncbi:hypothetical protein HDU99_010921, partial [Rhizoclosmatium hyalinum]